MNFPKYPRTYHLVGSKGTKDIKDVPFSTILNTPIVIEEKVDGSCVGIGFEQGRIIIKHRNQEVNGEQWDLLKSWTSQNEEILYECLEEKYIMYGEWLFATHTIPYDKLPQYFLEYDVFDTQTQRFLSTPKRRQLLAKTPIISVQVLAQGLFKTPQEVLRHLGQSVYRSQGSMEGLYLKIEDADKVISRYKYIVKDFLDQILSSDTHWSFRTLTKNLVQTHVR